MLCLPSLMFKLMSITVKSLLVNMDVGIFLNTFGVMQTAPLRWLLQFYDQTKGQIC